MYHLVVKVDIEDDDGKDEEALGKGGQVLVIYFGGFNVVIVAENQQTVAQEVEQDAVFK